MVQVVGYKHELDGNTYGDSRLADEFAKLINCLLKNPAGLLSSTLLHGLWIPEFFVLVGGGG